VENVEPKLEKDTIEKKSRHNTGPKETTSKTKVVNDGEQKRPGASRYF
jgi:hypothetical protein